MSEFDLASFREEFEKDYQEPETVETETEEVEDALDENPTDETIEEEIDTTEPAEPTDEEVTETDEVEEEPVKKSQTKEENKAFAELRKQKEALELQAQQERAVLEQIASQYNMTPEQFKEAYAEQQLKKRAEDKGVPVDVLKRLETLEQENQAIKFQSVRDRYMTEITSVKDKYGITDEEAASVFRFIGENGFVDRESQVPTISFEQAYKLSNFDTLMERKVKEENQKRLADKKARQQKSALPHSNASTVTNFDAEEITDDFVMKRLKEKGLL